MFTISLAQTKSQSTFFMNNNYTNVIKSVWRLHRIFELCKGAKRPQNNLIFWIKLEEDLILSFPVLIHEAGTWSLFWNPFKTIYRRVVPKSYLATINRNKINENKILWKYCVLSIKLNQYHQDIIFGHSFYTMLKKEIK